MDGSSAFADERVDDCADEISPHVDAFAVRCCATDGMSKRPLPENFQSIGELVAVIVLKLVDEQMRSAGMPGGEGNTPAVTDRRAGTLGATNAAETSS